MGQPSPARVAILPSPVPAQKAFAENMKDVPVEPMDRFDHLGYEVRSALSRGYAPGIGERMADAAAELLQALHA